MHLRLAVAFRAQAKPGDQAPPFMDFLKASLEGALGDPMKDYMR